MTWARATAAGVICGVVGGCAVGMISWLSFASTYPGGLSAETFVKNTGEEMPMLTGNIVAISAGAVFSILVTYITRWNMTKEIEEAEWDKTRDIDNPLSPWVSKYQGELDLEVVGEFHDRPPLDLVISKFRSAKITSFVAAAMFTIVFVVIWPCSMLSVDILDGSGFNIWTTMSRGWAYVASAFIVIVPLLQELLAVKKQLAKNKKRNIVNDSSSSSGYSNNGAEIEEETDKEKIPKQENIVQD